MLDHLTVRPILSDELEDVAYLRAIGFGWSQDQTLLHMQNNPRYNFSHILVAEDEGRMIGTVAVFPAQLKI